MNASFREIAADKIITFCFFGALFFIALHAVFVGAVFGNLPPFLPLFNQMPWGQARLVTKIQIFLPLVLVFFIIVSNAFFSLYVYKKMPLISRFLTATSFIIAFLALLLIARTMLIVL